MNIRSPNLSTFLIVFLFTLSWNERMVQTQPPKKTSATNKAANSQNPSNNKAANIHIFPSAVITPTPASPTPTASRSRKDGKGDGNGSWWLTKWAVYLAAIVLGAISLVISFKILKWAFTPKPTFASHVDEGSTRINDGVASPLVSFEVLLNPNLDEGFYELINNESALIKGESSRHG